MKAMHTLHTAFVTHFLKFNFLKNIHNLAFVSIFASKKEKVIIKHEAEPGYNDTCLSDISYTTSDVLRYQLIPHC